MTYRLKPATDSQITKLIKKIKKTAKTTGMRIASIAEEPEKESMLNLYEVSIDKNDNKEFVMRVITHIILEPIHAGGKAQ